MTQQERLGDSEPQTQYQLPNPTGTGSEKIGQYYFEVDKGQLVNNGKMIEVDEHGSKRFTGKDWRNLGKQLMFFLPISMAGGFAATGLVEALRGTPILEFANKTMTDSDVLPFTLSIIAGMFGTMGVYLALESRLRQIKIQRSFIRS
ncbi:MAG: hypothetical protein Q7R49_03725 [Candidatus Daviesbacteria bacterium]|nr:hypothetical protein [Candidatus Daviesbacteria bacterium]